MFIECMREAREAEEVRRPLMTTIQWTMGRRGEAAAALEGQFGAGKAFWTQRTWFFCIFWGGGKEKGEAKIYFKRQQKDTVRSDVAHRI